MPTALQSSEQLSVSLGARESAEVLHRAVERGAVVHLLEQAAQEAPSVGGTLVGETASCLVVEPDQAKPTPDPFEPGAVVVATLRIDASRFTFRTTCDRHPSRQTSDLIYLRKPESIARAERRRSRRRRLRQPTPVTIRPGRDPSGPSVRASLLNVSPEGLACRVSATDAEAIGPYETVHTLFTVSEPPVAFELTAAVVNLTDGATGEDVIVGLEFVDDESSQADRRRLKTALTGSH